MARSFSRPVYRPQVPRLEDEFSPGRIDLGAAANMVDPNTYGSFMSQYSSLSEIPRYVMNADEAERRAIVGYNAQFKADEIWRETKERISNMQNRSLRDQASENRKTSMLGNVFKAAGMGIGLLAMSDEKTKNCVEKIDDALTILRKLNPVQFNYTEEWSVNPERVHHGFIAQEYQKVMPDATYFDESKGVMCIDTMDLIGLLVRAVQQLETKVTRLEAKQVLTGVR